MNIMLLAPVEATAENGLKYKLMGEYYEELECVDDDGSCGITKVPVSWSTIKDIYRGATEGCETVEVVDVEELKAPYRKDYENASMSGNERGQSFASARMRMIDKFTQNGYQIIRKVSK